VLGSLCSRVLLLFVVTCTLLVLTATSFYFYQRSTQREFLANAERHLGSVASTLLRNYVNRPNRSTSLAADKHAAPPVPQPPPPPAPEVELQEPTHKPPPPPPHLPDDPLSKITEETLRREDGIEGGFFSVASGSLIGYAFPTHEGPGSPQAIPARERPTIDGLVRAAVATASQQTYRFEGSHDAVLFIALPVREFTGGMPQGSPAQTTQESLATSGAVWLMRRIPGADATRNRQLITGAGAFGLAALLTGLLAFFIISEVRSDVGSVLRRLGHLESDLSSELAADGRRLHLDEFRQVHARIDRLAETLREKIGRERALEQQIRHQERLSALGRVAAGIAHELRNPLATIRLRTQMMQRAGGMTNHDKNAGVVVDEIDRLNGIIGRLLQFARPIDLSLNTVDLTSLAREAARDWAQRTPEEFTVACESAESVICIADRARLRQVCDNLIENAVQAVRSRTNSGGHVLLQTGYLGGFAYLDVCDDGPGIPESHLSRVLEPFFTTKDGGTGLGLSISYELVQAHGGDLLPRHGQDGGACIRMLLPREPHAFDGNSSATGDNRTNG
jgi:signal transduction histidine kinase